MYKEEETNLNSTVPGSGFASVHKFTLSLNDQTAVIFSTEHIQSLFAKVGHMQFIPCKSNSINYDILVSK